MIQIKKAVLGPVELADVVRDALNRTFPSKAVTHVDIIPIDREGGGPNWRVGRTIPALHPIEEIEGTAIIAQLQGTYDVDESDR